MNLPSRFRKFIRQGARCLALVLLVSCLAGCSGWEMRNQELRPSDLSATARQARSKADGGDKAKNADSDDLLMSDRAKQISRDLQ